MLTTRAANRDKVGFFNTGYMLDVLDGERPIGEVVLSRKKLAGSITLDGKPYDVARERDEPDEVIWRILLRLVTGRPKPPPNPYLLKDGAGQVVAQAAPVNQNFAVTWGGETLVFRKHSRRYELLRADSEQPLGWVGREKMFGSTMTIDLPASFAPPVQVFLLALVLIASLKAAESSGITP